MVALNSRTGGSEWHGILNGVIGAPDLLVEITSPTSLELDTTLKPEAYLKAGVPEFWIICPDTRLVTVNVLQKDLGVYRTFCYGETDAYVPVSVLDGCFINMVDVFKYVGG